jgi:hypothetical protein
MVSIIPATVTFGNSNEAHRLFGKFLLLVSDIVVTMAAFPSWLSMIVLKPDARLVHELAFPESV